MRRLPDNIDQETIDRRCAARTFIEESCALAKTLESRKKCLFIMHFSNGFTVEEIAKLCQTDAETVTRRLKEIVNEINEMRRSCKERKHGKTAYESTNGSP